MAKKCTGELGTFIKGRNKMIVEIYNGIDAEKPVDIIVVSGGITNE